MSLSGPERVSVFAPATVANVGPGFDVFGLALKDLGDQVEARRSRSPEVSLTELQGDLGALPTDAQANTAGIAASATLRLIANRTGKAPGGVELRLSKGTPLASGLGSSAASAAAAAKAIQQLFPGVLSDQELLGPCLEAEGAVSGFHLDNVAASLLGGFVLVQSVDPIVVHRLPIRFALHLVAVKPAFGLPTRESRAALPREVPLVDAVANLADATSMIHALHSGDRPLFVRCLRDRLVEPVRAGLIQASQEVWTAAREAGAEAVGISGGGPSLFAVVPDREGGTRVGEAMRRAWEANQIESQVWVTQLSREGARRVQ